MKPLTQKDWQIYCDCGSNHNGDLDRAKQIIQEVAKLNGVVGQHFPGVKFQLFQAKKLWAPSKHSPAEKEVQDRELQKDWIQELIKEGRRNKIAVGFTAFDDDSLTALMDVAPSIFFKVSSFDLLRLDFIRRCALGAQAGDHPLHISTGGASVEEIEAALDIIARETPGLRVYLYHCVSEYPLSPSRARIFNMVRLDDLARKFDHKLHITLGWSDHTRNVGVVCRSMATYGEVAEVHVDLNDGLGFETKYGHVWTIFDLIDLASAIKGFHDCMDNSPDGLERPDLRADPEDGLRPLKKHRPPVVPEPKVQGRDYTPYWTLPPEQRK